MIQRPPAAARAAQQTDTAIKQARTVRNRVRSPPVDLVRLRLGLLHHLEPRPQGRVGEGVVQQGGPERALGGEGDLVGAHAGAVVPGGWVGRVRLLADGGFSAVESDTRC